MNDAVITGACRTPIGGFLGSLSTVPAPELGAVAIRDVLSRSSLEPADVQEVIMGNVISAGLGQAPARQAALLAGIPPSVETMTVNKVCGSGLKSVMLGVQAIRLEDATIVVAGGMESMSRAPHLLMASRAGYKMGNTEITDSMVKDGLLDVYSNILMGNIAETCARECSVSREAQDEFAIRSYRRAQDAQKKGLFAEEIAPVQVKGPKGAVTVVSEDEDPFRTNFEKIPALKPAFDKNGTITPANASKISDGAAALALMSGAEATKRGIKPLARILGYASAAKDPQWFTTAPADVIPKALNHSGMSLEDVDLFEVNEAFAVVALAVNTMLNLDIEKVNVNGGAIALGHPLGASGARILVTLLHALKQRNKRIGLAAICIGGGEASSVIVERMD